MLQQSRQVLPIPITGPDVATLTADDISVAFGTAPGAWHPVSGWDGATATIEVGPGSAVGVLPLGDVPIIVRIGEEETYAGSVHVGVNAWTPTVEQVHALIASRPAFTLTSRPTAADVADLVQLADDSLSAETAATMPAQLVGKARLVVALHAAALVESTFFPEQQYGDRSPADVLFGRYQAELLGLRALLGVAINDGTGGTGASDDRTFVARSMTVGMDAYLDPTLVPLVPFVPFLPPPAV